MTIDPPSHRPCAERARAVPTYPPRPERGLLALAGWSWLFLAGALGAPAHGAVIIDLSAEKILEGAVEEWRSEAITLASSGGLRAKAVDGRQAIVFDGTQTLSGKSAAIDALTHAKAFTIEIWADCAKIGARGALACFAGKEGGSGVVCSWSTALNGGAFRAGVKLTQAYKVIPEPNTWHHLAWTWERGKGQLGKLCVYVDGVLDDEQEAQVGFMQNPLLYVGNTNGQAAAKMTNGFTGAIASVRVHDVALGPDDLHKSSAALAAYAPTPSDHSTSGSLDVSLGWKSGSPGAQSFAIYLGGERAAVERGDESLVVSGKTNPSAPVHLQPGAKCFWRVEERDAAGAVLSKGAIWGFTADPGLASGPEPRDGDGNVVVATKALTWSPGRYGTGQRLLLATDRSALEGGGGEGHDIAADKGAFDLPSALKPGTRYFWRVDVARPGATGPVRGEVWRFRTQDSPIKDDVTFFVSSDSHYGREDGRVLNQRIIAEMNSLPGTELPAAVGGGVVRTPLGLVMNGDLVDVGFDAEVSPAYVSAFYADYGLLGHDGLLCYPLYEGFGNHDGGPNKSFVRKAIKERNPHRLGLTAISPNGLHYSWDWENVHFVNLNLFGGAGPADVKGVNGPEHDPEASLEFLVSDLAKCVGASNRPIVVFQHFGWIGGMADWWQPEAKDRFYDAVKGYKVAALINGHSHGAAFAPWKGLLTVHDGATSRPDGDSADFLVVHISPAGMTITQRKLGGTWGMAGIFKVGSLN